MFAMKEGHPKVTHRSCKQVKQLSCTQLEKAHEGIPRNRRPNSVVASLRGIRISEVTDSGPVTSARLTNASWLIKVQGGHHKRASCEHDRIYRPNAETPTPADPAKGYRGCHPATVSLPDLAGRKMI